MESIVVDERPWGWSFLALSLIGLLIALIPSLPILPCDRCGNNDQLMGYTRLPGVTREQAAQMIAWAESFPCSACNRRRRVSPFYYLYRDLLGSRR